MRTDSTSLCSWRQQSPQLCNKSQPVSFLVSKHRPWMRGRGTPGRAMTDPHRSARPVGTSIEACWARLADIQGWNDEEADRRLSWRARGRDGLVTRDRRGANRANDIETGASRDGDGRGPCGATSPPRKVCPVDRRHIAVAIDRSGPGPVRGTHPSHGPHRDAGHATPAHGGAPRLRDHEPEDRDGPSPAHAGAARCGRPGRTATPRPRSPQRRSCSGDWRRTRSPTTPSRETPSVRSSMLNRPPP